jgi:ATP-binding cassette, subfamily B, bacterial PglK
MIDQIRRAAEIAQLDGWTRWLVLVVLALVVSGLEAVGALLIYVLLGMVTGASDALNLPLVGDIGRLLPDIADQTLMIGTAAVLALFFMARAGIMIAQSYVTGRILENAGARMSRRLANGYLGMPYAFHLRRNSAELIRNAYSTANKVIHGVFYPVVKIASHTLIVLALFVVLLATAPIATALVALFLMPVAFGLLQLVNPHLKALGRERQDLSTASLRSLQQSLGGVRDIKILGRERFFQEEFGRTRSDLARVSYRYSVIDSLPVIGLETVLVVFIAGLFAATVLMEGAAAGAIPVLGLFAYAALRLKPSIASIAGAINSLRYTSAGFEDVQRDLELTREGIAGPASEDVDALPFRQTIELIGMSFRYEGAVVDALSEVNVRIRRGESIGVVGPTGGGKTTLVDVILGLLSPTEGTVRVDGEDIRNHTAAWMKNLGMVPQELFLVDDTLRRNIALGVDDSKIDEERVRRAVRMAQLEDVVATLDEGLDTTVGERGVRLSGGQRQRVAIARALYRDPSVVIFDEGTSALDNVTEAELMAALELLRSDRTLIIVAHRLSTVRACDRVLFVRSGRIVDEGTYDELLAHDSGFRQFALEG